ncbi:hypothetical protein KDM41_12385 [bacterium]|nr:hypothetical protein [bacterium]
MRGRRGMTVVLCAVLLGSAAVPCAARAQAAAPADFLAGPATAVLFFVEGQPHAGMPAAVARMRRFTLARTATLLAEAGRPVVESGRLDGPRREWRVRSGMNVGAGFLDACRRDAGAAELVLLTLVSRPERLVLMGRLIGCADGSLRAVAIAEGDVPRATANAALAAVGDTTAAPTFDDPADRAWQRDLADLAAAVVAELLTPRAVTADDVILFLPASGVGTNADADLAATHLYLRGALAENRWRIVDPAVAVVALQTAGLQSRWVGAEARRLLEKDFGARSVILSELISFDATRRGPASVTVAFDAAPSLAIRDFLLSLRLVDLRTGGIIAADQLFVDTSRRAGWFGRRFHRTLLQEIDIASRELWQDFLKDLEDN